MAGGITTEILTWWLRKHEETEEGHELTMYNSVLLKTTKDAKHPRKQLF